MNNSPKKKQVVERAAELMGVVEEGRQAGAELEAIKPALREALAGWDGKMMRLFSGTSYRAFLIGDGVLRPYDEPELIYSDALDEPTTTSEGAEGYRPAAALQAVPA